MIKESKWFGKLKFLGKWANIAGWVSMGVDATVTTITEYNNQNSRAYKSGGKSVIHATFSQLKNVGPIEGAVLASGTGIVGTVVGFLFGTANMLWGVVNSESKDMIYSGLQNITDDIYDFVDNLQKGKAVSGAIGSIKPIFKGGLGYE